MTRCLLEWQSQCSLHAADEETLAAEQLSIIKPELLADLQLLLKSSSILFSSPYPAILIRDENLKKVPESIDLETAEASNAIIFRKNFEVNTQSLKEDTFYMLSEFDQGQSINQAWQATQKHFSLNEAQLSASFSFLLNLGIFKGSKQ